METLVRAATLNGYLQVARQFGLHAQELLREVGLDVATLADSEHRIPISTACRLLEVSSQKASCPAFGLLMAETRRIFDFGVGNLLLAHARTLREMLLTAAQYRHLLNDALGLHVESAGDTVIVREEIVVESGVPTHQATELAVGVLARSFASVLGQSWRPRSVHFTHPAPRDLREHRRFFACPLVFQSEFNGIVCAAADMDYPNPTADPELVRYAESLAAPLNVSQADTIVVEVRQAIYLLLPLEQATVEKIAARLHLSVRSMQRKLDRSGTSFSGLIEAVRLDLAQRYMVNASYSIGRVAALLGYSRQSSFTHWFTARFGVTPRAWRARYMK